MTGFVKVERIGGGRVGADARVGNGEAGIDDGVPFWNAEKRPEINACHSPKILTFRILRSLEIEDSKKNLDHYYSPYKSFNAVEFRLCGSLFFISLANMAVSLADIGGSKVAVVLRDSSGTNPALPSPPTTEFKTALLI